MKCQIVAISNFLQSIGDSRVGLATTSASTGSGCTIHFHFWGSHLTVPLLSCLDYKEAITVCNFLIIAGIILVLYLVINHCSTEDPIHFVLSACRDSVHALYCP